MIRGFEGRDLQGDKRGSARCERVQGHQEKDRWDKHRSLSGCLVPFPELLRVL